MKIALILLVLACVVSAIADQHTFTTTGDQFLLDGKPFQIRSGEMHYSRVPRPYWRDRLLKMKAMGLNTVSTYMFWNMQEPEQGQFNFSGNDDVAAFVREAQKAGMYVLLRPGPYACAEWEWGGYPYWLANIPDLKVRSKDPRFLDECGKYLHQVGKQLSPLQITHGGPILLVQVENEYGSYGNDKEYLGFIRDTLRKSGFDCPLYTVDGPSDSMITGGTLPDVFAAVNFGGDPAGAFQELAKYRTGEPQMCGEFYPGWFDQWGQGHSTVALDDLKDFEWMMSHGVSFSMYMVHGGWTPGFMNGANVDGKDYHPQTNSYYDDTCIDDAGRLTAKYDAYRRIMAKYLPKEEFSQPPVVKPVMTIPTIQFTECAALMDNLPKPITSSHPLGFEEMHQPYGFVLYRHELKNGFDKLELRGLQDRAIMLPQQTILDRRLHQEVCDLDVKDGLLDILVENLGRVNYGSQIVNEHKGIPGGVFWANQEVTGNWMNYGFPMDSLKGLRFSKKMKEGPAWYRANFDLDTKPGDTFLDMRPWNKGVVWVNGHNLGRYWHIGPQQTIYVPGCWLNKGKNEIVVFELGSVLDKTIRTTTIPIWADNAS